MALHQPQLSLEDEILRALSVMQEADVDVGGRVVQPAGHRKQGRYSASAGDKKIGAALFPGASEFTVWPVGEESGANLQFVVQPVRRQSGLHPLHSQRKGMWPGRA